MPTPYEAIAGVVNACQLGPTLLTGGQPEERHLHALKEAGVEIILDLRDPMEPRQVDEASLVPQLGMEYVNIPVRMGALTDEGLDRTLVVLRRAGGRHIFCHCSSGGRVGGTLLPYLMLDLRMNEDDAVTMAMHLGLRNVELLDWGLDYVRRQRQVIGEP